MPSSVIRNYSYDAAQQVLTITFVSGAVYDYLDVPPEVHEGLERAPSRGRYFAAHIRDRYHYVRGGRGFGWRRGRPEPPESPEPQPALPGGPSSPNAPLLAYAEKPAAPRRVLALRHSLPRRMPTTPRQRD